MRYILSYGGGTQSTALLLLLLTGLKDYPRPEFAVWADTGAEPLFINEYVKYFSGWVKENFDFDIFRIQHKTGLLNHLTNKPSQSKSGNFRISSVPPLYTLDLVTDKIGMLQRQCTSDFKTNPINKFITGKLGRNVPYTMYIGLSFDEIQRMKISNLKKRTNSYPLIEMKIRRQDSIRLVIESGLKPPQRSSCFFCPYHSNTYWKWLKKFHPSEFFKACRLEITLQKHSLTNNPVFLHKSCVPLSSVDFSEPNQLDMFPELIDECGAECGI